MKRLVAALLALALAACGGGGDTSSDAGNESTFGTSASEGGSGSGSSAASGSISSETDESGRTTSDDSGTDGTYRGEMTATLSGEGILPVTDSTELVIEISGSDVTATAEERSYTGELEGDTFEVKIPIDEEKKGITCQGEPVLQGKVGGGTASGTVSGTGECFSDKANVPVSVKGEFVTRK